MASVAVAILEALGGTQLRALARPAGIPDIQALVSSVEHGPSAVWLIGQIHYQRAMLAAYQQLPGDCPRGFYAVFSFWNRPYAWYYPAPWVHRHDR